MPTGSETTLVRDQHSSKERSWSSEMRRTARGPCCSAVGRTWGAEAKLGQRLQRTMSGDQWLFLLPSLLCSSLQSVFIVPIKVSLHPKSIGSKIYKYKLSKKWPQLALCRGPETAEN